jgi:hypothetical protein
MGAQALVHDQQAHRGGRPDAQIRGWPGDEKSIACRAGNQATRDRIATELTASAPSILADAKADVLLYAIRFNFAIKPTPKKA